MTAKQTVRFVPCDPPIAATKNEDILSHESVVRSTAANESQVKLRSTSVPGCDWLRATGCE